tara:strand:- start:55 stop:594 length:540 start_codon:yes stop_codon:yes gene_type:complete
MGQFGNQPDFITNDIKAVTPVLAANLTAADSLNGSIIYVGTSAPGNLQVIPVGAVGPSVISGFSSPGYAGSEGTGYADDDAVATTGGSGTGLTVDITALSGAVQTVVVNAAGAGYLNGDLITIAGGVAKAVFRIEATAGLPTAAQAITFTNVIQGEWLSVVVDYVLSDATTVSNLIAGK